MPRCQDVKMSRCQDAKMIHVREIFRVQKLLPSLLTFHHPLVAMPSSAQMDLANRALCFALRHPPKGQPKVKFDDIIKLVKKQECLSE